MPEFEKLGKQIQMQVTPEGLRIELLEGSEATFFDSGSAKPKTDTERLLAAMAKELGGVSNDIVIEGHTDSQPYTAANGYSNWELSADRANAARRVMERSGLRQEQLKGVRGYAATRPRIPEATRDPRNRRVSIVVITNASIIDPLTDLPGSRSKASPPMATTPAAPAGGPVAAPREAPAAKH
jgi:chemotaxis protein MotB